MILTLSYAFLVTALIGLGALYAEGICADLGKPRRLAWCVALPASIVLPAYALLVKAAAPDAAIISLPLKLDFVLDFVPDFDPADVAAPAATAASSPWLTWPDWAVFDSAVTALWVAGTALVLLIYVVASLMLRRVAKRSEPATVGDQPILVSDDVGPAVFGIFSPAIVLPRWLAEQDSGLRSLVLRHEREHLAGRDHLLLVAALAIVATMPWNLALWWQLRRLRTALEMDCDARVLRHGVDPREYSEALFTVGQRPAGIPLGAVALTEPVSELERRIRTMLEKTRRFSIAVFGSRVTLVLAATVLAIAVNAPNAQQSADDATATSARPPSAIRTEVYDLLNHAHQCMDDDDLDCARAHLAEVSAMTDLSTYETAQLYNFQAFAAFNDDDMEGTTRAYESLLGLPREDIPAGLVRGTMRNLATLYMQQGRYEEGLDAFDDYLELPQTPPSADDQYLKATVLYQMERYEDAFEPLERAIAMAEEPAERWYQLLYVLQYQTDDYDAAVNTLETLNARWPSETWEKALDYARLLQQGAVETLDISAESDAVRQQSQSFAATQNEDFLPIVRVAPIYPPRAAARGLEGYVVVSYTVNTSGTTEDINVLESSATLFEQAAIDAVEKYKYRPRIIDGQPVAVEGATSRIVFVLENDDP